jgi:hypothetical protein
MLSNPIYLGRLTHRGQAYEGVHYPIIDRETWVTLRPEVEVGLPHAQTALAGLQALER